MTTIRPSTPADAFALTDIWRAAVQATHDFLSAADFRDIENLVAEHYIPNASLWVAADAQNRPLGFMGMTGSHVDSLFIDPVWRGRGIGSALMAHAEATAGLPLSVDVNEQNGQAVGFYRHLGFEQIGRSPLDDDGRPYPILHMRRPAP
jgi:putative acetyltransferase